MKSERSRRSGFRMLDIRRLFLTEGILLAVIGSLLGLARSGWICGVVDARVEDVVGGCGWHDVVDAACFVDVVGGWRDRRSSCGGCLYLLYVEKTGTIIDAQLAFRDAYTRRRILPQRRKGAKKSFPWRLCAFACNFLQHCLHASWGLTLARRRSSTNPASAALSSAVAWSCSSLAVSFLSSWLKRKERKANSRLRLVDHRTPRLSKRHLSSRPHRSLHHFDRRRSIHHRRSRFIPALRHRGHRSEIRHRRFSITRRVVTASGP